MSETPPPEVPVAPAPIPVAEPPKPQHVDRVNLIAALLASFVGVLALGVSVYASYWQRQAVRAQVWPILSWGYTNGDGFGYVLANVGVGPAEIRAAHVTLDGKPFASWKDLLENLCKGDSVDDVSTSYLQSRVVGAGSELHPLQIAASPCATKVEAAEPRIVVELCYCSVLDECWKVVGGERKAVVTCGDPEFHN